MDKRTPRKPQMEKAVYSVAEIAALLGVSLPTAYEIARSEGFPSFSVGKRVLTARSAFERWLADDAAGKALSSYRKTV